MTLQVKQKEISNDDDDKKNKTEYLFQEKMIGDLTQYQSCEFCIFCDQPIRRGDYTDIVIEKIPAVYNNQFDMYIATDGKDDIRWYHKKCEEREVLLLF